MNIVQARVLRHAAYAGDYRILELDAPAVANAARPGQFVHLRVPNLDSAVLRRPFSIYRADGGTVAVLYKKIGRGTAAMGGLGKGDTVSLLGPLGNGFPMDCAGTRPALVAGGYGVAPLAFLARRLPCKGVAFIGAATAADVLCREDFAELGWELRIATDDGSLGLRGFVTAAVDEWLGGRAPDEPAPEFFACGPEGMLRALGERAMQGGWKAWLSLDVHMGCGVGACLACVHRIRRPGGREEWARVCRDGPIFEAREIVWE